ncbi:MAG TPA: FlgD immunoglobulin-like domain containing protein [Candidatus Krumholzibacteria bacterium]|nr:FlgD immunoglobulin-like domain containing protein [Candidatus Krumholzibacteria bacterium]
MRITQIRSLLYSRALSCVLLTIVFTSVILASIRARADCIDYSLYPYYLTGFQTPGQPRAVAIEGNYAYVADGAAGLTIVDLSDPESPSIVSSLASPDSLLNVTLAGNYAYLPMGPSGLLIVDKRNPSEPKRVNTHITWVGGDVRAVQVRDLYAYVVTDGYLFHTIDLSDRTYPKQVAGEFVNGQAFDMAISGNYVYLAEGRGLEIVDITDPLNPQLVSTLAMDSYGRGVRLAVSGSNVYISHEWFQVKAVDVSTPSSPVIVGKMGEAGVHSVAIDGDYALVGGGRGIQIMDVHEPGSPVEVGRVRVPGRNSDIAVANGYAAIASQTAGLVILKLGNLAVPQVKNSLLASYFATDVAVAGNMAYVTYDLSNVTGEGFRGMHVIDVSNPDSPPLRGSMTTSAGCRSVAVTGDHAFVCSNDLLSVDVSDPSSPHVVASVPDGVGPQNGVVVSGNRAYVVGNTLTVVDISQPANPVWMSSLDQPVDPYGITKVGVACVISGSLAYIAEMDVNGNGGLRIVDITNPYSPTHVKTVVVPGRPVDVAVEDNYAFVAAQFFQGKSIDNGLYVIDLNDIGSAAVIASMPTREVISSVAVRDHFAYALSREMLVLDVSDPHLPKRAGCIDVYQGAALTLAGDSAFMIDGQRLRIAPVQCPAPLMPVLFANISARSTDQGAMVSWNLQADEPVSGFEVYRREPRGGDARRLNDVLLDEGTRTYLDSSISRGTRYDYFVAAVLPDGRRIQSQVAAVETEPLRLSLKQNYPNPFNPRTTISFTVPSLQTISVSVYDVEGRLVSVLLNGEVPAGEHSVTWNGRNQAGMPVASGVYLCLLKAHGQQQTQKMILLK